MRIQCHVERAICALIAHETMHSKGNNKGRAIGGWARPRHQVLPRRALDFRTHLVHMQCFFKGFGENLLKKIAAKN